MENLEQTILSQYSNSARILALIASYNENIDQTANIDAFYLLIMDVDTAVGIGLDIWGRIVGVSRNLPVQTGTYFGFAQQDPTVDAFGPGGQSPFYSGGGDTSNYTLSDAAYRQLILAKALANICDGSIPGINNVLLNLFPGAGEAYVTDDGHMSMTYTFAFALDPVQTAIVYQSGVLPKPVGVTATVVVP